MDTSHAKAFWDAMLIDLLNPKVILVFLAITHNLVRAESGEVPLQLITLGAILIAINTFCQILLTLAANGIRNLLDRQQLHHIVN